MSSPSNPNAESWRAGLRAFIAEKRQQEPLPRQEDLEPKAFQQFRIIGGELIGWYEKRFQHLIESRVVFEKLMKFELSPFAVIQTSLPGLVASQLIWSQPQETLVFVTKEEFEAWTEQHPDEGFHYHVLHWSDFTTPSQQESSEIASQFPELDLSVCYFHEAGDLYGPQMGFGGTHLWQWKEGELSLVKGGFKEAVY